jgi:dUTP pyrophosphatase
MDIYSPEEYNIECGQTVIIPIGIKVSIPHGYALLIQPRSGMSARMKIRIPNSPGLIDEDYHEEIGVIVENTDIPVKDVDIDPTSSHAQLIKEYGRLLTIGKGERFAQMRLVEVPRVKWREVNSLGTQIEDHGKGFGHSGQF